jgi:hypothetical protein
VALVAVGTPRRVRWVGPPMAVAVGRVRCDLRRVLTRWRVREDVVDEVVLAVAELLGNVVRYARSGFCVRVELDEHRLYVAVEDDSAAALLPPSGTRTTQLGRLRLVNPVALRQGWHEQDAGKTVWAEFSA